MPIGLAGPILSAMSWEDRGRPKCLTTPFQRIQVFDSPKDFSGAVREGVSPEDTFSETCGLLVSFSGMSEIVSNKVAKLAVGPISDKILAENSGGVLDRVGDHESTCSRAVEKAIGKKAAITHRWPVIIQ
jgi:hypothetical protein